MSTRSTHNEMWIWLAGFTDGDGTIIVSGKQPLWRVTQHIDDEGCLDAIEEFLADEGVTAYNYYWPDGKHRVLQVNSLGDVEFVVSKILPWLLRKRSNAELVLSYIQARRDYRNVRDSFCPQGHPKTPQNWKRAGKGKYPYCQPCRTERQRKKRQESRVV